MGKYLGSSDKSSSEGFFPKSKGNPSSPCGFILFLKFGLCVAGLLSFLFQTDAANWPQSRGPEFNGSTPEKNLPGSWSKTENIAWSVGGLGNGSGTPIIWQEHVFISVTEPRSNSAEAMALDRRTGRILWRKEIGVETGSTASISPVTDGKKVIFTTGAGDIVVFDFSGREVWRRNWRRDYGSIDKSAACTSFLLFENKVCLQAVHSATTGSGGSKSAETISYILAFDFEAGKPLWQRSQKSVMTGPIQRASFSPQMLSLSGRHAELLDMIGGTLTGRDPKTGDELWHWNAAVLGGNGTAVSMVCGGGVTLVAPQNGGAVYALKSGGTNVLWHGKAGELSDAVASPVYYDGDFFVLSETAKTLTRIEAKTGLVKWKMETPGAANYTTAPIAADGKIFCWNQAGEVLVTSAADGSVLGFISMGDGSPNLKPSMAISQGQLFIRTMTKLYCIGKNDLPVGPTGLMNQPDNQRIGQPEGSKRRLPL